MFDGTDIGPSGGSGLLDSLDERGSPWTLRSHIVAALRVILFGLAAASATASVAPAATDAQSARGSLGWVVGAP